MGTQFPTLQKGGGAPQFPADVYCGQRAGWIKMALGMKVNLSPCDFVLDWDHPPAPKSSARPPIFGPFLLWPNGGRIKMPLGMEVGLSLGGLCVRWGLSPLPKKGPKKFSAHVFCGQTAGSIKMALCLEVGLSPGDFVLDGNPALPSQKGGGAPNFDPCLLRPNGCMDQDATWYGFGPRPTRHCLMGT